MQAMPTTKQGDVMKRYEVLARETVIYSIYVEADNEEKAKELAKLYISEGDGNIDYTQDFMIDGVYEEGVI